MPQTGSTTSDSAWVPGEVSGEVEVVDTALLHVLLRVGVELRLAALRAEIIGLALVFAGPGGLRRVHVHAAYGILHRCLLSLRRTASPFITLRPRPSGHMNSPGIHARRTCRTSRPAGDGAPRGPGRAGRRRSTRSGPRLPRRSSRAGRRRPPPPAPRRTRA